MIRFDDQILHGGRRNHGDRLGELTVQGVVPKLSDTPGEVTHLGVEMGKHTAQVLEELGDVDPAQLDALRAEGVI